MKVEEPFLCIIVNRAGLGTRLIARHSQELVYLSDPNSLIAKGESSWMKGSASVGKITCSEGLEGGKGEGGRRREEE